MAVDKFSSAAGPNTGLIKIVPTSIAVGSGSGSVDVNGNVTFSGVSSITINNIFSSVFENYSIVINSVATTANIDLGYRFADGSGVDSTSNYQRQLVNFDNTTVQSLRVGAAGNGNVAYIGDSSSISTMTIAQPNLNTFTTVHTVSTNRLGSATRGSLEYGGYSASKSFTGVSFIPGSGTLSGTIRIYGYNQ